MEPLIVEGVEFTIVEINNPFVQKCKGCVYYDDEICRYKKDLALKPNKKEFSSTEIIINVKNKTNKTWDCSIGDWELIDSEGFSYQAQNICSDIMPARLYEFGRWSLSPKTQANYVLFFPEIEQNKNISKIIFAGSYVNNSRLSKEIVINDYSQEIEDEFKYEETREVQILSPDNGFYDKFGIPRLRASDGHFVRSQKEIQVDDYLFSKKISHIYECQLPINKVVLCDWFLPEYNIFVEYWGFDNDENYISRKDEKMRIYENNGLNLISLFETDLIHLDLIFEEQLNRFGITLNDIEQSVEIIEKPISSFIAIDFETANNNRNSVCALGVVIVENNKIVVKKEYCIQPPTEKFDFTGYHGIKWEMVKNAPKFFEIWDEVKSLFNCYPNIVAHNMVFDKGALKALVELYSLELPEYDYYCTLQLSKKHLKLDNYKLETVCKSLNLELTHHQALSDAKAAAEIMIYLNNKSSENCLNF